METYLLSQDEFSTLVNNPSEVLEKFDNDYKIWALLDVVSDQNETLVTNHDFEEESIFLLSTPENVKSNAIYKRYQKNFLAY